MVIASILWSSFRFYCSSGSPVMNLPPSNVPRRVRVRPQHPAAFTWESRPLENLNLIVERPLIVALQVVARLSHRLDLGRLTSGQRRLGPRRLVDPVDLPLHAGVGGKSHHVRPRVVRRLVGRGPQIDIDLARREQGDDLVG